MVIETIRLIEYDITKEINKIKEFNDINSRILFKIRDDIHNKCFKNLKSFKDIEYLCINPHYKALEIISENIDKLHENGISMLSVNKNPNVVKLVLDNIDKVNDIRNLCISHYDEIIEYILEKIDIDEFDDENLHLYLLCSNQNHKALEIIDRNFHKLDIEVYENLFYNPSDKALDIINKNINNLNSFNLSNLCHNTNPKVIDIILNNVDKFSLNTLCNINHDRIVEYILTQIDKLDLNCLIHLCSNPNDKVIELIKNKLNIKYSLIKIFLCKNPNDKAIEIVTNNPQYICLYSLCSNPCNNAAKIVIDNLEKLDDTCWTYLYKNPNPKIVELVLDRLSKMSKLDEEIFKYLSQNTNDKVLDYFSEHFNFELDYDSTYLYNNICSNLYHNQNPKAHDILLDNFDKLDFKEYPINFLLKNPKIFIYDYDMMKQKRIKMINKIELNNIRLKRALYYKTKYHYNLVLDEYI